jgi:phosphotriesterase-related protein
MTVTGAVDAAGLGLTLPHEHVHADLLAEYRGSGLLDDESLAVEELRRFAAAGGGTLVDLTTDEIGRDPALLARVATASGVRIVMGCGHYRQPYLDRGWFDRMSVDAIADDLVREITAGVGDTGVRPGIIGEIGCDRAYPSAIEERSFRAAARAHRATGLTISTHAARWPVGLAQLDLLAEEGVDPRRVIVGHADTVTDADYPLALARRGCFVEFDGFGTDTPHDLERGVRYLMALVRAGRIEQVLVSHDVFLTSHLHAYGGCGYDFVPTQLVPRLRAEGLEPAEIDQITVVNPRRALTGE